MLFFTQGCITDRQLVKVYRKSKIYNEFAGDVHLNGIYQNSDTSTDAHDPRFSEVLFPQRSWKRRRIDHQKINTVELRYDGDKRVYASLHFTDGTIQEKILQVRNRGNYLSIKRRYFVIPIPLLYYMEEEHKALLINDADGRLITAYRSRDWGNALIILGGAHDNRQAAIIQPISK